MPEPDQAAVGLAKLAGLEPHVALQAELRGASWEALTTLAAEAGSPQPDPDP